jgi:transposase
VRRFCEEFRGQQLEVALEATTGWRFVAEEFRRVGAVVHLAEPAETSVRRGNKKRAKSDRADARHVRELLMIGRLPESWIPSDHLLNLRARVRLRHTLSHQRGEWQERIQAVLYHHGCPQRSNLMTSEGRGWLSAQLLLAAAREQITVALSVIDALERQLGPLDRQGRVQRRPRHPRIPRSLCRDPCARATAVPLTARSRFHADPALWTASQRGRHPSAPGGIRQ